MRNIHVLMLAYYFPPDSSSGAFRPLFFSKHLTEMGIKVTVLTADDRCFLPAQSKDLQLLGRVHPDVSVIRAGVRRPREALIGLKKRLLKNHNLTANNHPPISAFNANRHSLSSYQELKDTITDLLAFPDQHMGWIPGAIRKGKQFLAQSNASILYATGSPWSALVAGVMLKRSSQLPLVIDFRDPWVSNPDFQMKSRVSRFLEAYLERLVISSADMLISTTQALQNDFLHRYPFLSKNRVQVIYNGFENYLENPRDANTSFTLTHAGSLYPPRRPHNLIYAIDELITEGRIPAEEIRLVLIGELETYDDELAGLLKKPVLSGVVEVYPRLAYETSLAYQLKSDVLICIQTDFPLQIPRKLYEYLALQRPILAITNKKGATAEIIDENRLGTVVPDEIESIKKIVFDLYLKWKKWGTTTISRESTQRFKNEKQSEILASLLLKLI